MGYIRGPLFGLALILTSGFLALGVLSCAGEPEQDELWNGFIEPPSQSRPFVRWWWNGNRVTLPEALRELDLLAEAGVGGVEINPIAMPPVGDPDPETIAPALEWLSPEWNRLVKAVAAGARERGLISDIIVGSGWPFGGRFLQPGELLQIVTVYHETVRGPSHYSRPLSEVTRGYFRTWDPERRHEVTEGSAPRLLFLRLVPADATDVVPGEDLMESAVRGDQVEFEVPAGSYELYAGSWREGFRHVELGAPGADGPVVDHFSATAVRRYLDRMSEGLASELGRPMGDYFRAVFCDSLELGEVNWATDFREQFESRRGYDPWPFLHYMVENGPVPGEGLRADKIRRLRYDFDLTLAELFGERFTKTLLEWAHQQGVQVRIQSYGRETHSIDSTLPVDLPEGESWIWDAQKTPHPTLSNRFTASAAHLAGRRIVSAETFTNTTTVFRTLPYQLKQLGDLTLLTGVTHFVLHGFNYSPPEAGFPGWVRFGTYFSEHNPWWPFLRLWSDYAARVSWVLQNSVPQSTIAILSPDDDVWSEFGRPYYPFPEREAPLYAWRLWEAFHRAGYNTDYVSDRILLESATEEGTLTYGDRRYEGLVVPGLRRMPPAVARKLEEFARSGGRLLFVERFPSQGPSFLDLGGGDDEVLRVMASLQEAWAETVHLLPAPEEAGDPAWGRRAGETAGLEPDVRWRRPSPNVSQIHHRSGDREIFFIVNSSLDKAADMRAEFPGLGEHTAWRWDPETGERAVYTPEEGAGHYAIHLEPQESLLLVFEPGTPAALDPVWSRQPEGAAEFVLHPTWQVNFRHAVTGDEWRAELAELVDLASGDDPRGVSFAGTVEYTADFEVDSTDWRWLDLGEVYGVSRVWLNDRELGIRWWGRHRYELDGALQLGGNRLRVQVVTHLGNYVRSAKDNPVAQRWASWYPVEPIGLIGPVRLK